MSDGSFRRMVNLLGGTHLPTLEQFDAAILQDFTDVKVARASCMMEAADFAVGAGDGRFVLPSYATELEAVFFCGTLLEVMTIDELKAVDEDWEQAIGPPSAVIVEQEKELRFRLYPKPNQGGTVTAIFGAAKAEPPDWLDVPLALGALAGMARHSWAKRDVAFASGADKLGALVYSLVVPYA